MCEGLPTTSHTKLAVCMISGANCKWLSERQFAVKVEHPASGPDLLDEQVDLLMAIRIAILKNSLLGLQHGG